MPSARHTPPVRAHAGTTLDSLGATEEFVAALHEDGGWIPTHEYPGYVCWSHTVHGEVYATPDWLENGLVAVAYRDNQGQEVSEASLPLPTDHYTSLAERAGAYQQAMHPVLERAACRSEAQSVEQMAAAIAMAEYDDEWGLRLRVLPRTALAIAQAIHAGAIPAWDAPTDDTFFAICDLPVLREQVTAGRIAGGVTTALKAGDIPAPRSVPAQAQRTAALGSCDVTNEEYDYSVMVDGRRYAVDIDPGSRATREDPGESATITRLAQLDRTKGWEEMSEWDHQLAKQLMRAIGFQRSRRLYSTSTPTQS